MTTRSIRLDGTFTLLAPLSHIGETISSTSYLVEDSILQPDGAAEKVFAYSGNAWRGQLRDLMASYMLDKLDRPAISLDAFHLLYSGGKIGGPQTTDLGQARRVRAAIPMISLLGGGIGNQILQGKLRVGTCYPVCREAIPVLPESFHAEASTVEYSACTMVKEYSRRDDAKMSTLQQYLPAPDDDGKAKKKAGKADGEVTAQMRIRSELVTPGVRLRTWIVATDVTDVELGALVSGLHAFSDAPFIGGQSSRGHGEVRLDYAMTDLRTGQRSDFLRVADGRCLLGAPAAEAKDAYDQHLRSLYDGMLAASGSEIAGLLAA